MKYSSMNCTALSHFKNASGISMKWRNKGALKRIAHSTSMFSCDVGGCSGCLASPLQFSPDVALVSAGGAGAGLGLGFCKILDTLCSKLWKIKL